MERLGLHIDPRVDEKFANYPPVVRQKMIFLKDYIITTAEETSSIREMTVTLKWGEPSFVTKRGSTLRIDWKEKQPDQYAMYFQCTSRLVETFRLIYDQQFQFEGKRAIIFPLHQKLPLDTLRDIIRATLAYNDVKHLLTLGL